jgi:hypothetical protein
MKLCAVVWVLLLGGTAEAQLPRLTDEAQPPVVDPGGAGRPPSDAVVLFDGRDMSGWQTEDGRPAPSQVRDGYFILNTGDGNVYSRETFSSVQLHIEFSIPHMPQESGQSRGNSGIYLQGRYEIQVLDSYFNETYPNGMLGSIYGQAAPLVNAARAPGEWQSYDVIFHAPKCAADGTVAEPATITVLLNGVLTQDRFRIRHGAEDCASGWIEQPGPLMLQDHNYPGAPQTPLRYRNIWFRRLGERRWDGGVAAARRTPANAGNAARR